jgi:transposase
MSSRLRRISADQADAGGLLAWLWSLPPWRQVRWDVGKRPEGTKGCQRLPTRWSVARTFGWFGRYRRGSNDDEYLTRAREAMIRGAMLHPLVRRLVRLTCFSIPS